MEKPLRRPTFIGGNDEILEPEFKAFSLQDDRANEPNRAKINYKPSPRGYLADNTLYTEREVAQRLANPQMHADGSIFERAGVQGLADYARASYMGTWATEKVYRGPVYAQGGEPSCNAWAFIHAMIAVGREPSPALARDLLNAAVSPRVDRGGGVDTLQIQGIIDDHPRAGVSVDIPATLNSWSGWGVSPARIGEFVRRSVHDSSAVVAAVQNPRYTDDSEIMKPWFQSRYHAVCIPGYKIYDAGCMDAQVVDSHGKVYVKTIEELTRETRNQLPFAVVSAI